MPVALNTNHYGAFPQRFKDPIDRTDMEVHLGLQARPKPVDEGDGSDMHRCLVKLGRPWAVAQQALLM